MMTPDGPYRLFLAGDALMTMPWSHVTDSNFLSLVDEMRSCDTTIVNLETVLHDYEAYPQADCGGVHLRSPPEIAAELKWAGVDAVSAANNHSYDYGSEGVVKTLEHIAAADIILAGTGMDLEEARAARIIKKEPLTVSLSSSAATFTTYGAASRRRTDILGRPGLNPLKTTSNPRVLVPPLLVPFVRAVARMMRKNNKYVVPHLRWGVIYFDVGSGLRVQKGRRILPADAKANLAVVEQAAASDIHVVAIHAHRQGAWLHDFARANIDVGAAAIIVHGPHEIRGIEIYHGRPIFYSLGDFVFQPDQVSAYPTEDYERYGLGEEAVPADLMASRLRKIVDSREAFEGLAAIVKFAGNEPTGIELIPLDLQLDAADGSRGRPRHAPPELASGLIDRVRQRSTRYGTMINYDTDTNRGHISIV